MFVQVRRVVEDCINNIHPIYHIKTLMIKRELAKDPTLATENWERFLPNFKKRNVQRKKPAIVRTKEYTPFPPAQPLSKEDKMLESGEYFLSDEIKAARKQAAQSSKQAEMVEARQKQREEAYVPPSEDKPRRGKREAEEAPGDLSDMADSLKRKLAKASKKSKETTKHGAEA